MSVITDHQDTSEPRGPSGMGTSCRLCDSVDLVTFVDLGATPPCERFLTSAQLDEPEPTFPPHVRVCTSCLLVQLPPLITPEDTFTEYAYFSSFSTSYVEHAPSLLEVAVGRLGRIAHHRQS